MKGLAGGALGLFASERAYQNVECARDAVWVYEGGVRSGVRAERARQAVACCMPQILRWRARSRRLTCRAYRRPRG